MERFQEKPLVRSTRPVPQTDTGRCGDKPQALEKTVVKELGNLTPYVRKKGALVATQGAENRL